MRVLKPHVEVLPPPQRAVWEMLTRIPEGFVLYGGTAIALRLGHRTSVDFDFFSNLPFLPGELEKRIPWLAESQRLQSAPNTLTCLVDRKGPVKVSFFGDLKLGRVGEPEWVEEPGIWVASLLDLAATKVKVVQDRAEAKDYNDVAAMLEHGMDLAKALGAARAIYGDRFNPLLSLKALSFFQDGDLPTLPPTARTRLVAAARSTEIAGIPTIAPLSQDIAPEDQG